MSHKKAQKTQNVFELQSDLFGIQSDLFGLQPDLFGTAVGSVWTAAGAVWTAAGICLDCSSVYSSDRFCVFCAFLWLKKCSICNRQHSKRLSAKRGRAMLCQWCALFWPIYTHQAAPSCVSPVIRRTPFCSNPSKVVNELLVIHFSAQSRKCFFVVRECKLSS